LIKELQKLVDQDWIAVEMARRKTVFHKNEEWNKISLWGLFEWEDITKYLESGKLITHMKKENVTVWALPSKEYWEKSIKPIVDKFSKEDLRKTFR